MVASASGHLQRIKWDGMINNDLTIQLDTIPFAADLQHSRGKTIGLSCPVCAAKRRYHLYFCSKPDYLE